MSQSQATGSQSPADMQPSWPSDSNGPAASTPENVTAKAASDTVEFADAAFGTDTLSEDLAAAAAVLRATAMDADAVGFVSIARRQRDRADRLSKAAAGMRFLERDGVLKTMWLSAAGIALANERERDGLTGWRILCIIMRDLAKDERLPDREAFADRSAE
jgi:hypothetical protein